MATIRRGLAISPELAEGWRLTLLLAVIGTAGRVVVPIAVQQTLDRGINGPSGVDLSFVAAMAAAAAVAILATGISSYFMTARLFTASERGLATLRTKAFRHVHDLPLLTQNTERRGALVSRVTSDVDQVSQFLVFGGILGVVSVGQVLLATVVMLFYSWQLTILVWVCFLPLFLSLRFFQRRLSAAYGVVRRSVGTMLSAISEPVVGAVTVRTYAIEKRTQDRIDEAISVNQVAATRAQGLTAFSFSLGGVSAGLANAGVLIVGIWLGLAGDITSGVVLAFAFLVTLFVGPVQMGTQVLTDAQNAIAGWRRVIGILDTPADLDDPGPAGLSLTRGAMDVSFEDVSFGYPGGPLVLREVTEHLSSGSRVAVVGETGSGKTTFAKLLTRLMDPTSGTVLLDGVDIAAVEFASLRRRVVLVPQEGFLFDSTLLHNVRYGDLDATRERVVAAAAELGLGDWLDGLPYGLDTRVGQRGESLSAGERQLVALLRAHLADPDLLVLDEATSAVDPALEMRIGRALERLMSGPHQRDHRPPALHGGERRRGAGLRPRPGGPARTPRRPGHGAGARRRALRLRAAARLLGRPAGGVMSPVADTGRVSESGLDPAIAGRLKRTPDGLVPAVVQQHDTGEVLMLGWMDDEALHRTLSTGRGTFWSRSRQEYWVKGETSGNTQRVVEVRLDCDADTVLAQGRPDRACLPHRRAQLLRRRRAARWRRVGRGRVAELLPGAWSGACRRGAARPGARSRRWCCSGWPRLRWPPSPAPSRGSGAPSSGRSDHRLVDDRAGRRHPLPAGLRGQPGAAGRLGGAAGHPGPGAPRLRRRWPWSPPSRLVVTVVTAYFTMPDSAGSSVDELLGRSAQDTGFTGWFWTAAVASVVAVVPAALAVRLVPTWPEMGSRYDAPVAAGSPAPETVETDLDLWHALDEGRDPTDRPQS